MRVGLFSLYPFRPQISNLEFLIDELQDLGHETFIFGCFNRTKHCYYKGIYGDGLRTCVQCNLGQLSLKNKSQVYRLSSPVLENVDLTESEVSTIATLNRLETRDQIDVFKNENQNFVKVYKQDIAVSYFSFRQFIVNQKIDFVIGFNGRMDHTKAYFKACADLGIPFISYEYAWFGNGIQLITNGDCLTLDVWKVAHSRFSEYPLSNKQALLAAGYAARRFGKKMVSEWRDYSGLKTFDKSIDIEVLILPSSRNEFEGHKDYISFWGHSTKGFKRVLETLGVNRSKVYLQLHPVWFQNIYGNDGSKIIEVYTSWAKSEGINILSKDSAFESKDLIQECNILLINGSSACFEAGILGKPIINVESNRFVDSGMTIDILQEKDLSKLAEELNNFNMEEVKRRTLRFFYTCMYRVVHFEDKVRNAGKPTELRYQRGIGKALEKLLHAAKEGFYQFADDVVHDGDSSFEDKVIELIVAGEFPIEGDNQANISYRNTVERLRSFLPKGDRIK